ncbi:hypothetical protein [Streptomyces sparsus]
MQRRLVHAGAWVCATSAAAALSWFGVHTVLSGTAYDPPRAVTLPADAVEIGSSTRRPKPPEPTPSPSKPAPPAGKKPQTPPGSPSGSPSRQPSTAPPEEPPAEQASTGRVRSYPADGGLVVFDLEPDAATLVSATPDSGWQVQVWQQDFWIRVTFSKGDRSSSVFCTWHDSAPRVQLDQH